MSYDYNFIVASINKLRQSSYCGEEVKESVGERRLPRLDELLFQASHCINPFDDDETSCVLEPKIANIEALSQAVEEFSTLASLCPMVPTLWLQYAYDATAIIQELSSNSAETETNFLTAEQSQIRIEILEAALAEFPGCGFLWVAYIHTLMCLHISSQQNLPSCSIAELRQKLEDAFERALFWICRGSHYNSEFAGQIWKLYAYYAYEKGTIENSIVAASAEVAKVFAERAKYPLKENELLNQEAAEWRPLQFTKSTNNLQFTESRTTTNLLKISIDDFMSLQEALDAGRRTASQLYSSFLQKHELAIQTQAHSNYTFGDNFFGMGLGDLNLASDFISYAKDLGSHSLKSIRQNTSDASHPGIDNLMVQIFERGIAECPTVENIWIAYIKALERQNCENKPSESSNIDSLSIVSRGIRNCPHSVRLFCLKMACITDKNRLESDFDSDLVMSVAKDACELGFLQNPAEDQLAVWLEACRSIRRALMFSVSHQNTPYDSTDDTVISAALNNTLAYVDSEEIEFLIEDLRECFDLADTFLQKLGSVGVIPRVKLLHERALTEANVIFPVVIRDDKLLEKRIHLVKSTLMEDGPRRRSKSCLDLLEAESCFENAIKLYPTYAPVWSDFRSFLLANTFVLQRNRLFFALNKMRALYHREILNAQISSKNSKLNGDVDHQYSELMQLCRDFITFEESYGSRQSLDKAISIVQAKTRKIKHRFATTVPLGDSTINVSPLVDTNQSLRKRTFSAVEAESIDIISEHSGKTQKRDLGDVGALPIHESDSIKNEVKATCLKKPRKKVDHHVSINGIDYPAHPFTVSVSNLSSAAEDMDLVKVFRSCGNIVHARVLREKTHRHGEIGMSKGKGLVQFEERESVEEALKLHDLVGLNERTLIVERSHIPAVPHIVPIGSHNWNSEKKNGKDKNNGKVGDLKQPIDDKTNKAEVLSFRPRVVTGHSRKKILEYN